jgi:hypothetical protein
MYVMLDVCDGKKTNFGQDRDCGFCEEEGRV